MKSARRVTLLLAILALCMGMASAPRPWTKIRDGKLRGISGMVLMSESKKDAVFLIVHDNKKAEDNRLAVVGISKRNRLTYSPLAWPNAEPPYDAEAMTAVPGAEGEYMVCTSGGSVSHIKIAKDEVTLSLLKKFKVPTAGQGHNYEGFTLQKLGETLVVAWGHRGSGAKPGTIFAAAFDAKTGKFGPHSSTDILVPWPTGPVRHISDLTITPEGRVYGSAASDPGDDGPFACAVYEIGSISCKDPAAPVFVKRQKLRSVYRGSDNKAESLIVVDENCKRFATGSDDENAGGSIHVSWL